MACICDDKWPLQACCTGVTDQRQCQQQKSCNIKHCLEIHGTAPGLMAMLVSKTFTLVCRLLASPTWQLNTHISRLGRYLEWAVQLVLCHIEQGLVVIGPGYIASCVLQLQQYQSMAEHWHLGQPPNRRSCLPSSCVFFMKGHKQVAVAS